MTATRRKIPSRLAARLRRVALYRCGYCLTDETLMGMRLEIEHIIPLATGGVDEEANLWPACRRCNGFKGAQTHAPDAVTGRAAPLFNPRAQNWPEHFAWNTEGTHINGLTPTGRATVAALKLNSPEIVVARRRWAGVGWWPPED